MDRPDGGDREAPAEFLVEQTASGWDAYAVWQDRVRRPRADARSGTGPRRSAAAAPPPAHPDPPVADGWDPLETWRKRVQRARGDG